MTTKTPLQSIQTPDLLQEQLARLKAEFPDLFTNEGQLNPAELLRLTGQSGREHFDFQWWGKSQAKRNAFTPTTAALRYDEARSVNPGIAGGNAIIEGENLEVLKLLLCAYRGQVKCIYIDPPYNTGNDFVYKDNFKEGERAYWEQTGVTQDGVKMSTNTRADGRYHSNWLNMIYPRLLVARQLLRDDGVIFVSIDDNEVMHLRKVMDEVFGEENFVAQIVWSRKRGKDNSAKFVSRNHEYLIVYAHTVEKLNFNRLDMPIETRKAYRNSDDDQRGDYRLLGVWARGGQGGSRYTFQSKNGQIFSEREWLVGQQTMNNLDAEKKLVFVGDKVYRKFFLTEHAGDIPLTIWDDASNAANAADEIKDVFGYQIFDTPKPIPFLKRILKLTTFDEDICLDFYAGSNSTAHAALELNAEDGVTRKVISVQIPEATDEKSEAHKAGFKTISDITIERVKRVIQGYGDNPQPIDVGFKVFTLQKSAFPRADFAPDPDATEPDQLAALKAFIADKEASLFNKLDAQTVRDEVLLKCGFQLDVQLTPIAEVTANQLYRARDKQTPPREAIVCFDNHLDTATLEWLRQQKSQRVIVLEAALDTTGKWNLHHQLGDGLVVF